LIVPVLLLAVILVTARPAKAATFFGSTSTGDIGQYTSAAIIDDIPNVAYYDATNGDLRFIACFNALCDTGTISTSPDTTGNVGKFATLAVVLGRPIVAYYDETNGDLKFLACGNSQCSSGNIITTLDSVGNVGQGISMAVNGTNISIAYYDVTNGDLKLLRCGNIVCNANNTIQTLDSTGNIGEFTSIDYLGTSSLSIAYYDTTNSALKYLRCSNSACSSASALLTLDSLNVVGKYPSIKGISNIPVISYYDETSGNLKVFRCGDINCSTGNVANTVDSVGDVGSFSQVGIINSLPMVAYYDASNTRLKVARCADAACGSGTSFLIPDPSTPSHGRFTSFYVEFDQAVITYYDATNTDLRGWVNNKPITTRNTLNIVENSAGNRVNRFNLSTSDPDGDTAFTYTVTTPPTKGTLNLSTFTQAQIDAGQVTYTNTTPGSDFFNMQVTDGLWTYFTGNLTITTSTPAVNKDTIAIYRDSSDTFYLRNSNSTGPSDLNVYFHELVSGPKAVAGDWDGDGVDTVGLFDSGKGQFFLQNGNSSASPITYTPILGASGDVALAGDWDGDRKDSIGVFSGGIFYLRNSLTGSGSADYVMPLGSNTDLPVVGDWNGDGIDTPGVYRPSTGQFFLTNTLCNCVPSVDYAPLFGSPGDVPLAGDWDGNGADGIGVFRVSNGLTYLRNDATTTGFSDLAFFYGVANDTPLAGHWIAGALPPQPNVHDVIVRGPGTKPSGGQNNTEDSDRAD
jgi:hypothetical protein